MRRKWILITTGSALFLFAISVYSVMIWKQNAFRSRLRNKVINIEANSKISLTSGEVRQFLTYLHADQLRTKSQLFDHERQQLEALTRLLTLQTVFLEEAKQGTCIYIDSTVRPLLNELPPTVDVYTSPDRAFFLKDRLLTFAKIRSGNATELDLKWYRERYNSNIAPPPSSPKYYDPESAAEANAKQILSISGTIRTNLNNWKLSPF